MAFSRVIPHLQIWTPTQAFLFGFPQLERDSNHVGSNWVVSTERCSRMASSSSCAALLPINSLSRMTVEMGFSNKRLNGTSSDETKDKSLPSVSLLERTTVKAPSNN